MVTQMSGAFVPSSNNGDKVMGAFVPGPWLQRRQGETGDVTAIIRSDRDPRETEMEGFVEYVRVAVPEVLQQRQSR